jgi:UDP-GlcNAc:undecaprenyl-phosphate GlcNAc-1-phosphate transferase
LGKDAKAAGKLRMMPNILVTTLICLCLVPILERFAPSLGLLDHPDSRKHHIGQVPLVGGIAIYCSLLLGSILLDQSLLPPILMGLGLLMLLLGSLDDLLNLSAKSRLLAQICIASLWFHAN